MGRHGPQDSNEWRDILRELRSPLAHLGATQQAADHLSARGFRKAAIAVLREVIYHEPKNHQAVIALAWMLELGGNHGEAAQIRKQCVELDIAEMGVPPEHRAEAVEFRLAALGGAPLPERAPASYVTTLFNGYADEFDAHLTKTLAYRGPEIIHETLVRVCRPEPGALEILDAGCGTGLAGPLLKPWARRLTGVDLSGAMLAKAAERQVYDHLHEGDLIAHFAETSGRYDLIVAVDVLIYFGDFVPLLLAAASALRPGGSLVFSIENGQTFPYRLSANRRFEHHPEYIRQTAQASGLDVIEAERATLRYESGSPVKSEIFVTQRVAPGESANHQPG
jgi:predicted TPR repeat methyltransferase